MTCVLRPDVRYRMPVMFGPAPGPRQKHDGTPWRPEETGTAHVQWATLAYRSSAARIEALLPPGFRLVEPTVHVSFGFFRDLYWLAGRGYGILNVEVPVVYSGRSETIEGGLCLVLWEGRPDAVMTGREELGFPKLFADIPDVPLEPQTGRIAGRAAWLDHRFFEFEMQGLREVEVDQKRLLGPAGTPLFYKYIPRTGAFGSGGSEAAYVTSSMPRPGTSRDINTIQFGDATYRKWRAESGSLCWHRATFEQLPTTCHVVNGLADLDNLGYVSAAMVDFRLPGVAVATNGHRIVEPA